MKSAYYEAKQVLKRNEINRGQRDVIWRWLWTVKTMPKVKYFMWRLMQRFIPTRVRLQEKGIEMEFMCAVC